MEKHYKVGNKVFRNEREAFAYISWCAAYGAIGSYEATIEPVTHVFKYNEAERRGSLYTVMQWYGVRPEQQITGEGF